MPARKKVATSSMRTKRGAPRRAQITRSTKEVTVDVTLALDGTGNAKAKTGIPFFDHMLEQLGKHAGFDLTVRAKGDLEVDAHHTVEAEFKALARALGEACRVTGSGGVPSTKGKL